MNEERSYSRQGDLDMSLVNRMMGDAFPMCDVDALWYDNKQPVAIIDWKHYTAQWALVGRGSASLQAQRNLANGFTSARCPNGLPFFVIMYQPGLDPNTDVFLDPAVQEVGVSQMAIWRAYGVNGPAQTAIETHLTNVEGTYRGLPYFTMNYDGLVYLSGRVRGLTDVQITNGQRAHGLSSGTPQGFFMENLKARAGKWNGWTTDHVPSP